MKSIMSARTYDYTYLMEKVIGIIPLPGGTDGTERTFRGTFLDYI